jgi:uncharacterized protein (TIGR03578 family)
MADRNALVSLSKEVSITGSSTKSQEDAVNNAFSHMRSEVSKIVQDPILSIKPSKVFIKESIERDIKERFFFLFLPRIKKEYVITLSVVIDLSVLKLK